jgi:adenosylcobinamide-phosphate synthase
MLPLELQIVVALLLDAIIGDPQWFPHPVRIIGSFAALNERIWRRIAGDTKTAGFITWLVTTAVTGVAAWVLLIICGIIHPILHSICSIVVLYFTIAVKDLIYHGREVRKALLLGDIEQARKRVGFLVSRETEQLGEAEIARSAVESLAENSSDGIIAPVFFALLGGPVLALLYKTVSTLDSMFGYQNRQYRSFGWFSAKADDVANFVPARITAVFAALTAPFFGRRTGDVFSIVARDGRKNPSPNAGVPEAAFAGVLGVELGGRSRYFGKIVEKPVIGEQAELLTASTIGEAIRLIMFLTGLFVVAGIAVRVLVFFFLFLIIF